MKTAGIIGGMGPLATVECFHRIVENTKATKDQEHINLLISNHATIPDRTEAILKQGKYIEEFLSAIKKDFEVMNREEVELIAIPCNTSHAFMDEYKKYTEIPIINMVEETVKSLSKKGVLFATQGTIELEIYQKAAQKHNKELIVPDKKTLQNTMNTIYEIKKNNQLDCFEFQDEVSRWIENDYEVILACTELSLINFKKEYKNSLLDAMDVLVREVILRMDKKIIDNCSLNI